VLILLTRMVVAALATGPLTPFDKVLLDDGRMIEGDVVEEDRDGYVVLALPGAEVPISLDLVDQVYVENLEDYVPKNRKEERYLERGWVLFEGSWMSRTRREAILRERKEAEAARLAEIRRRQDWRRRYEIETRHFEIESNCAKEIVDEYAEMLEQYYDQFTDFWNITLSPGDKDGKVKFFLYRNERDFHQITGTGPNVGGFFSPLDMELHLPYDDRDPGWARHVLYHEGNHLLTQMVEPSFLYPIWLNEGMAEYYGTAEVDEDGDFELGEPAYGRIVSLRRDRDRGEFMSLREVLTTEKPSFTGRHYAMAWSFVHFLMESDEYARSFRNFFANLPDNRLLDLETLATRGGRNFRTPTLDSVLEALEKQLGASVEELEQQWLDRVEQYGELDAPAYYLAAKVAIATARETYEEEEYEEAIEDALGYYEKACSLGIEDPDCYRDYSELLRTEREDGVRAWEVVQKAIERDPINPYHYMEAAGVLMMDGPQQDLDHSYAMAETANALAAGDHRLQALYEELMALLEPAREARAEAERLAAEEAARDKRQWMVFPFYFEGLEPEPDRIEGLATVQLREMIREGEVGELDWIFQDWGRYDESGELVKGEGKWNHEWVQLKDIPIFAEDLAAAEAAGVAKTFEKPGG